MDSISPRKLDSVKGVPGAGAGDEKRTAAPEREKPAGHETPVDTVYLSNLSRGKKLGLIIEAKDQQSLAKVKERLLEQNPNNRIKVDLPLISGFAVELDPSSIGILPELGKTIDGFKIFLDEQVSIPEPVKPEGEVGPLLDVATRSLNLDKLWEKGITGKGVTIGIIDTGIAPHPDLKERIIGFKDFVNNKTEPYDDQGHGTHVSGIAAGNGAASQGKYSGAAPEANLVGVKVLNKNGSGTFSDVIAGIQWAVENKDKYNIRIISMSLGARATESYKKDPVAQACEAAIEKGIVTVVAAGNSGPSAKTIGTPAHAEHVITVGASDDRGTVETTDDTVASFSSRGPTKYDDLPKPDVVSPGVKITAPDAFTDGYINMSGTSMATPLTAGVMALLLQTKPETAPLDAKALLMQTADKLPKYDEFTQGAGLINPVKLIPVPEEPVPPPV